MDLEYYKQLFDMICDEVNVRAYAMNFGKSEKGDVVLIYSRAKRDFNWSVGGEFQPVKKWANILNILNHRKKYHE